MSMRNKLYYGDKSNADFGVIVTKLPGIPIAEADGEWVTIPGADGERFVANGGVKSVSINIPLWIPPDADINAVTAWLAGANNLRIDGWPWYWRAQPEGQITLAPCTFNDGWTTTAIFKARPHRYLWPEADAFALTESGTIIQGQGTADAQPIITITGEGDITVMIGGSTVMVNNLSGEVTLDCETKMAYSDAVLMTGQTTIVDGVWPTLSPETTAVSWLDGVSKVEILPRWRYR